MFTYVDCGIAGEFVFLVRHLAQIRRRIDSNFANNVLRFRHQRKKNRRKTHKQTQLQTISSKLRLACSSYG